MKNYQNILSLLSLVAVVMQQMVMFHSKTGSGGQMAPLQPIAIEQNLLHICITWRRTKKFLGPILLLQQEVHNFDSNFLLCCLFLAISMPHILISSTDLLQPTSYSLSVILCN